MILVPRVDPVALDGRRLEASVSGVADRAGNATTAAVTWRFDCRRSLFTWSETRITRAVPLTTPGSVSARLVNGADQAVDYQITGVPNFLSVAPPEASGRLAPGGERTMRSRDRSRDRGWYSRGRSHGAGGERRRHRPGCGRHLAGRARRVVRSTGVGRRSAPVRAQHVAREPRAGPGRQTDRRERHARGVRWATNSAASLGLGRWRETRWCS